MSMIKCTLPNASNLISGIAFSDVADGVVSGELTDDELALFVGIQGYEVVTDDAAEQAAIAAQAAVEAAALAEQQAAITEKVTEEFAA